jgi:hypothetical protein
MTDRKTWEQRVAAWRASGQSAQKFAEGRDYTVHMLRYWAGRVKEEEAAPSEPSIRLARVVRAPAEATALPSATTRQPAALVLEVSGARVQIPAGFERATLRALLEVLRESDRR